MAGKRSTPIGYSVGAISETSTRKDASVWFDCNGLDVEVVLPHAVVRIIAFPAVIGAISKYGRGEEEI